MKVKNAPCSTAQRVYYVYPETLACSVLRQILEETTDRNRFWILSFVCVFSTNSKLQFHTSSGRQPACMRQQRHKEICQYVQL